ncbi:MAG: ComEC/Rec2 family competence protein [Clostridia bacterium]|nr:ComEC/Rec2 family competence protein [Clostridia bacterium]
MRRIFLGFSSGIALCAAVCCYLFPAPPIYAAVAAGFCGVFFWAMSAITDIRQMRAVAAFAAGICLVCSMMSADSRNEVRRTSGLNGTVTVEAVAADFPTEHLFYSSVPFELTSPAGKKVSVLVNMPDRPEVSPGDVLRLTLDISAVEPSYYAYLRSQGYSLSAYCTDWSCIGHKGMTLSNASEYLRHSVLEGCDRVFKDRSGFFSALLFGDKSGLRNDFLLRSAASGTAHVYAVSGLHTSFIASVIFLLAGKRRRSVALFGIPILILFTAAGGFSPSLVRSAIMYSIVMLGYSLRREPNSFISAMAALTVLLLINPWAVTDIRLQLSFVAVFSLITVGKRLSEAFSQRPTPQNPFLKKAVKTIRGTLCATLAVQFGTIPLMVIYFSSIPIMAIVANILILPVISAVFIIGLAALLLGFISLPAAVALAYVAVPGAAYVTFVTELLGSVPYASVGATPSVILWIVFFYLLAIVGFIFKPRRAFLKTLVLSLTALAVVLAGESLAGRERMLLRVVDMGSGQCVILSAGGRTAIVDCGSSAEGAQENLVQAMLESNLFSADLFILTSSAPHHSSGAEAAVDLLRIDRAVCCFDADADGFERICSDTLFELGELKIHLLLPLGGEPAAVYAEFEGSSVFIRGDLDDEELDYLLSTRQIKRADIFITNRNLPENIFETISPKYVIISDIADAEYSTSANGDLLFTLRRGRIIEGRT